MFRLAWLPLSHTAAASGLHPASDGYAATMKKLLGFAGLAGGAWLAARRLATGRTPKPADVDVDHPERTMRRMEHAAGEPVRP